MERVQGVVKGGALLGLLVCGTEEYPLLRCCHLSAHFGVALFLQSNGHRIELVTELSEVLILPAGVVLAGRWVKDGLHV